MDKKPKPMDKAVGARIRSRRLVLGLSQTDLADQLNGGKGLTFQQVQKYEKGTNRVGASRLEEIAKALKMPPSFFFGETADGSTVQSLPEIMTDKRGIEVVELWPKLSPEFRAKLADMLTAVVEDRAFP